MIPAVADISPFLERQKPLETFSRAFVGQGDRTIGIRLQAQEFVLHSRVRHRERAGIAHRTGSGLHHERSIPERRDAEPRGRPDHSVAVREGELVSRTLESLSVQGLRNELVWNFLSLGAAQAERELRFESEKLLENWPVFRQGDIEVRRLVEVTGGGVEYADDQRAFRTVGGRGGERDGFQRLSGEKRGNAEGLVEAVDHVLVHRIDGASADAVVGMILQEVFPGDTEVVIRVFQSEARREGAERLRPEAEFVFAGGVLLFQADTAGEHAGNEPLLVISDRIATGFAQLAGEKRPSDRAALERIFHVVVQVAVNDLYAVDREQFVRPGEERGRPRLNFHMIAAIEQEQRPFRGAFRLTEREIDETGNRALEVEPGIDIQGIAYRERIGTIPILAEPVCRDRGAVRSLPSEEAVMLALVRAAPEKSEGDAHLFENLRELPRMAEHIADKSRP